MADDGRGPGPGRARPSRGRGARKRRRRRRRLSPAFVSGTRSEFLGRRPLPQTARERSVVFILGPPGVGKSAVARRLLDQDEILHLTGEDLQEALANQVRRRTWREDIRKHPALILDGPCFLNRRPAVVRMLRELLQLRADDGLRTMVCEAPDRSPLAGLMEAVPARLRATIALRFPVGRGRRRYAARVCDELGIDRHLARLTDDLDPWTYQAVHDRLRQVRDEQRRERRRRRRHALRLCEKLSLPRSYVDRVIDMEPYDKDAAREILVRARDDLATRRRRRRGAGASSGGAGRKKGGP